jgi:ADP-ribose pyrophosphatase YjhB (NUDIX family)
VPAGHVDAGELPAHGAVRELHEEVGVEAHRIKHVASANIIGDSCRRGSDAHRWHAYLVVLDSPKDLTYPVRHIIDRYAAELERRIPD